MTAAAAPLAGRGIVVTRPAQQSGTLAGRIRAAGGRAILFPVLEIIDTPDLQPLNEAIDRLDDYQLGVFISPNAVVRAMRQVETRRRQWPAPLRVAAIGKGSVRELERFGISGVLAPERHFDSEHLLELPELQAVAGQRVVIFRGDGGRELLGDTLAARGASPSSRSSALITAGAMSGTEASSIFFSVFFMNTFSLSTSSRRVDSWATWRFSSSISDGLCSLCWSTGVEMTNSAFPLAGGVSGSTGCAACDAAASCSNWSISIPSSPSSASMGVRGGDIMA